MDAAFTEEQDEIRRTLRELLAKRCGPDEVKTAVRTEAGYDERLWRQLAEQLGLPGLAVGQEYGGVGCGPTELALACEETGRALLPSPLLATAALAAPLLAELGTDAQCAELLPRLACGELTATLAVPGGALPAALGLTGPNDGDWAGGGRAGGVQARPYEGGWRLYGQAEQVLDGHSAGLLIVAAHAGGYARSRTLLFAVRAGAAATGDVAMGARTVRAGDTASGTRTPGSGEAPATGPAARSGKAASVAGSAVRSGGAPGARAGTGAGAGAKPGAGPAGLVRTRLTALDETRPQARIELRDTPAELLGASDEADVPGALARLGGGVGAVLAAEAVGAADRALTRTLEYVRAREQFGRPIGSFQAVKHRLADLYVEVQAARSAAYYAAWAAGRADAEPGAGGLALAQALQALRTVAAETVQLHGGIGFTWEHDAHLYFKRAAGDELLFGPVHRLRARAADLAGLFVPGAAEARNGPVGNRLVGNRLPGAAGPAGPDAPADAAAVAV
ncbi:acyl-CoA dehydrogenase family protein [Streptomyces sp. NPDC050610]|uniref:acyl-CoA dehydrogenase family protein n=1 Tax=Streptomyces sp. NPDC050610 TaxID=3157097 RepID=UPI003439DF9C